MGWIIFWFVVLVLVFAALYWVDGDIDINDALYDDFLDSFTIDD